MPLKEHPGHWTCSYEGDAGPLYYFAPEHRTPGPYAVQREVSAIIDIAHDGTLAGVELIDDMPPPPKQPDYSVKVKLGEPIRVIPMAGPYDWRQYVECGPFMLCKDGHPLQSRSVYGEHRFLVCAAQGVGRELEEMCAVVRSHIPSAEPIENDAQYDQALEKAWKLMDAKSGTPEAAELERLVNAISVYEDKHYPIGTDDG